MVDPSQLPNIKLPEWAPVERLEKAHLIALTALLLPIIIYSVVFGIH